MSALDPRVRALVDAARAAEPVAADRARVRAALALRLGPGALAAPRAPSAPAPIATTAIAKLVVAGALIGAAGFGGGFVTGRSPTVALARHGTGAFALAVSLELERSVAMGTFPHPVHDEPLAAEAPAAPPVAVAPARTHAVARAIVASPTPVERKVSTLVEETDLLRRARTSLGAGDAAAALAELDTLAARHPDGQLREERLAARVAALCAIGRKEEALREAERLLAESPRSIHAGVVRGSCAFRRAQSP